MIQLPCYILLLCISLYINIYHFYNFFEIYLSLSFSQKYFCHKFLWIFMDSPKIPLPLLGGQHPILLAKKGMLIFEKKKSQKISTPLFNVISFSTCFVCLKTKLCILKGGRFANKRSKLWLDDSFFGDAL